MSEDPSGLKSTSVYSEAEIIRLLQERPKQERAAIRALVDATRLDDPKALFQAFESVETQCIWVQAMRALSRLSNVPDKMKARWLQTWAISGDHIRGETENDRVLADALRQLLPPYQGAAIRLYRGDSAWNRRRRTYGLSWTASREVATGFAEGIWQTFDGGSVVLETDAPAEAVICALHLHSQALDLRDYEESEYLVDRRKLEQVRVIERFAQRDP